MRFEKRTMWLFPDSLRPEGSLFDFVELQKYKEDGQVMLLLGRSGSFVGEFQVFPSKVQNLAELQKQLGDDDTAWKNKKFLVRSSEDKKTMLFIPQ